MSAFTKGPWEVSMYGSFETLIRAKSEDGKGKKIAATWVSEARTKRRSTETIDEFYSRSRKAHLDRARQNEANAHLIAAAPELYEALDHVHKLIVKGAENGFSNPEFLDELFTSQYGRWKALKQARGETK